MYFYSLFCCQVFCNLFTHRYVRIAFAAPVDMQVDQSVVDRNPVGIVANRFPSGRKLKPIARIGRVAVYHRVIFDISRCVFADIRSKVADHGSGAYGSIASDGDNLLQASEMDFDLTLGKPVGDFYLDIIRGSARKRNQPVRRSDDLQTCSQGSDRPFIRERRFAVGHHRKCRIFGCTVLRCIELVMRVGYAEVVIVVRLYLIP